MKKALKALKKPELLSQQIVGEIEQSIRERKFKSGEKLPTENEFCELFSVSRTAVREALGNLSARGLVTIRKGSGVYVNEINANHALDSLNFYFATSEDSSLILQAIKARQLFEPGIAAQAAMHRTIGVLDLLELNLQELETCSHADIDNETDIDERFHTLIAKASGNSVVDILTRSLYNLTPSYKNKVFAKTDEIVRLQGEKEKLLRYHTGIFHAIRDQDSREAYYMMKEHLIHAEKNYYKMNNP
jgi:GntR family transcriptional repressor for pyruvate dehydrogenase complex